MTETEFVIHNFMNKFAAFQGKRIVLHGSRNYAEAIIAKFDVIFHFVGVMSLDSIDGEYFHGIKVLSEADLPALHVDLIILTERVRYEVEAFSMVRRACRINKIAIYNMYGLNLFLLHREAEDAEQLTLAEAKKRCDSYDMIAFEAMDTVLCSIQFAPEMFVRSMFCDLIKCLREQGKEIRFSLRKSLPADVQIRALKKYGVLLDEKRELIYREGEDLSFRRLREDNPGSKILYFGTGLANEFILPRYYGIDTCRFIGIRNFDCLVPNERALRKKIPFLRDLKESIKKEILKKDLISFDIFDTLLLRKTLYPRDVFILTEAKAILEGLDVSGFAAARIKAEENQPYCNIGHIYLWLEEHCGWSEETTQKLKSLELETERSVLVPRQEVAELLQFAAEAGKRVILTSDMYLTERVLDKLLSENGISGYEKILVSCDVKKAKHNGLFGELLKLCDDPDKILHIGDNPEADAACNAFGIRQILIPSAFSLAMNSGWETAIQKASTLTERCLVGLIISKLFRDPFQSPNFTDFRKEDLMQRFATCVVGPLVAGHLSWLLEKIRKESFAGVLFLARDGWISYNVYKRIQKRFTLPLPVYFYANRHSAFLCCADLEKETANMLDIGKSFGINAAELLKNVYQISENEMLSRAIDEGALDFIEKHMDQIRKIAAMSRKGYLRYSEKNGMVKGCSYAVVDFIAEGKTQKCLSQFMPFRLKGFYFGHYTPSAILKSDIEYYLRGENPLLLERYVELEPFFCSLEPSQNSISEDGTPVFARELRSEQELKEIGIVLQTAEEFAIEFFNLFYQKGRVIAPALIEEIYAVEDYYIAQHEVYDDWLGVLVRKRPAGSEKSNEKSSCT